MAHRFTTRADDERLLAMIKLRHDMTAAQVAGRFECRMEYVRAATNRVKLDDLSYSGEPKKEVAAAYAWGQS
jgi:hypothetical protein